MEYGKIILNNQGRGKKAKYKDYIIENLSIKLSNEFGRGFSKKKFRENEKILYVLSNCDINYFLIDMVSLS